MADIQKVMQGLECYAYRKPCIYENCPYYQGKKQGEIPCQEAFSHDAIKLLKKQQKEIEKLKAEKNKRFNAYLHEGRY